MTLSTTPNTITYTGNNSTTEFSFPYLFYDNSHLVVTLGGVTQTINTHYTVAGAGVGAGGTVTFITAPGTGVEVIIQRIVPYTQDTDLENFDGNPADVTEKQFDLNTMMSQQLDEINDRSIKIPVGESTTVELPTAAKRASKIASFDSSGNVTAVTAASIAAVTLPASIADNALIKSDGTGGDTYQATGIIVDDSNNITGVGTVDGRDLATDGAKLDDIEALADVTDETSVVAALNGATLSTATVSASDKVIIQDADDSDNIKTVTTQSIADLSSSITSATAQATTSGSTITFGSIPAGTQVIYVSYAGVSVSATGVATIRIGDAGGLETSGYLAGIHQSGAAGPTAFTTSFGGPDDNVASGHSGVLTLTLQDSATNTWCLSGVTYADGVTEMHMWAGRKSLSGELTQLAIVATAGVFNNGSVNISYQ